MTLELFRDNSYLKEIKAVVTEVQAQAVVLDQTIFYPLGGGQPGDSGKLFRAEPPQEWLVTDTGIDRQSGKLLHYVDAAEGLQAGDEVTLIVDWERRYSHMRIHTCLHLLCALIAAPVTGGNISGSKGRLDFALDQAPDKTQLGDQLNHLIQSDASVDTRWITDAEMDAQPELVRTLSVKPPRGSGKVRLVNVNAIDLQPCGGTHVRRTSEIGTVLIGKIENKGKGIRRINLELADAMA